MGRSPCCEKVGLKKGPWTPEEDQKLIAYIEEFGHGSWRALPAKAGLQRCGKSCRLRWTNYLRPDIKRGKFSLQEEQTIIQLHALLGNRWSAIAAQLPRRTDNEIKNYWNTHLKKRLSRMGIDPTTHKPKTDTLGGGGHSKDAANLSHMAQWESARLEAEARLGRESNKLQQQQQQLHVGSSSNSATTRLFLNKITPIQPSLPPCLDILKAWQSSWSKPNKDNVDTNNNINSSGCNKMHSMYAMMLSNDDTLESPTSTLNFPGTTTTTTLLPLPVPTTNNNNNFVVPFNQSNLVPGGIDEAWRYFGNLTTKQMNNIEENNSMMSLTQQQQQQQQQQDDDMMAAVEAFRSSGGFDNNIPQLISTNNNVVVLEALESSTGEENLAIINVDEIGNISCNVNLEENKHYWNSILGLVNDSDMSIVL